jgi:hypothetical protein
LGENDFPKLLCEYLKNCEDGDKEDEESCILPPYFSFFSNVLLCFQSPVKTLEKDTTTVTQLFHMSKLKGKLEQRNKDKYVGKTTEVYLMKLNSTKAHEVEKDVLSFYTNAIAYLMKWFNFSDKDYLKHNECISLSHEIECMLRFQPMVIMDELHGIVHNSSTLVGFEVLTAVSTKMAVFWVVPDDGGSKDL